MITDEMKFGKLRDEFMALVPRAQTIDLPVKQINGKGLIGTVTRAFMHPEYKTVQDCADAVNKLYSDGEIYVMYFDVYATVFYDGMNGKNLQNRGFKIRFMAVNGTNEAYTK